MADFVVIPAGVAVRMGRLADRLLAESSARGISWGADFETLRDYVQTVRSKTDKSGA